MFAILGFELTAQRNWGMTVVAKSNPKDIHNTCVRGCTFKIWRSSNEKKWKSVDTFLSEFLTVE